MKKITLNYKTTSIILATALVVSNILFAASYIDNKKHDARAIYTKKQIDAYMKSSVHDMQNINHGSMNMNATNSNMGDMTMNDMANMLKGKTGKALEKEFISGMIPHHRGAVDMANIVLQDKTVSPEIQTFARQIITAQEAEIIQMNEWLKKY
ncbi:MAG: hypothetical protein RI996_207 [Candidatus Parcubacteria bacterium]|jgi:uncharacterized protein (DUF305 family)